VDEVGGREVINFMKMEASCEFNEYEIAGEYEEM
jgi:hypothetical protein